jgi:NADH:ubiquinone oxidoreductase subunit 6 (subunit J)
LNERFSILRIQIAIYGVAVPILLGLAIMFTNLREAKINQVESIKTHNLNYIIFLTAGVFILALVYLFLTSYAISPVGFDIIEQTEITPINIATTFGNGIYVKYVWAFELVSLILTIIVVGLTMLKNAKHDISKEEVQND